MCAPLPLLAGVRSDAAAVRQSLIALGLNSTTSLLAGAAGLGLWAVLTLLPRWRRAGGRADDRHAAPPPTGLDHVDAADGGLGWRRHGGRPHRRPARSRSPDRRHLELCRRPDPEAFPQHRKPEPQAGIRRPAPTVQVRKSGAPFSFSPSDHQTQDRDLTPHLSPHPRPSAHHPRPSARSASRATPRSRRSACPRPTPSRCRCAGSASRSSRCGSRPRRP